MRSPFALLPAVAGALLLAACSGATGGGATGSSSDAAGSSAASDPASSSTDGGDAQPVIDEACSVLSADEATVAYGASITTATGSGPLCSYSGDGGAFTLDLERNGDFGLYAPDGGSPVSGLGDRAVGEGGRLAFEQGHYVVDLVDPTDDSGAKVLKVAQAISAKL